MKSLSNIVLLAMLVTGCKQQKLDPRHAAFLTAGEQAIVGSYTLNTLNAGQDPVCTLNVSTNHTFAISNLPVAGPSKPVSVTGSWSMTVFHMFDARGHAVTFAAVTNIVRAGSQMLKIRGARHRPSCLFGGWSGKGRPSTTGSGKSGSQPHSQLQNEDPTSNFQLPTSNIER